MEIPEHDAAECADRRERGGLDFLLPDEFAEFTMTSSPVSSTTA